MLESIDMYVFELNLLRCPLPSAHTLSGVHAKKKWGTWNTVWRCKLAWKLIQHCCCCFCCFGRFSAPKKAQPIKSDCGSLCWSSPFICFSLVARFIYFHFLRWLVQFLSLPIFLLSLVRNRSLSLCLCTLQPPDRCKIGWYAGAKYFYTCAQFWAASDSTTRLHTFLSPL